MAANPPAWRNPWEKVGHGRAKTNKTVPSSHKGKQQLQQKMWASHGKEESSCEFHEQQKKQRWRTHSSMWRLSSFEKQEEGKKKSGEWRKTVIKTERNEQGLRISEHKERSSKNYARGSATIENNGKKHLVVKNNDSKLTVWGTPRVASIPIATVNKSNTSSSSSSSNSSKRNLIAIVVDAIYHRLHIYEEECDGDDSDALLSHAKAEEKDHGGGRGKRKGGRG